MPQPEGPAAETVPTEPSIEQQPPARRGRGWAALGLLGCIALLLWCSHWLSSAQLSSTADLTPQTSRYTVAVLLTPLALGGLALSLNRLWRGRWLLWLGLFLVIAEMVLLIGAGGVLHYLGTETTATTALLAAGMLGCLGLGYLVVRWLRR